MEVDSIDLSLLQITLENITEVDNRVNFFDSY